jgi:hypothetical protein
MEQADYILAQIVEMIFKSYLLSNMGLGNLAV